MQAFAPRTALCRASFVRLGVLAILIALPWAAAARDPASAKTVYSFHGSDGATPRSSLLQGSGGNLYGTTFDGALGYGTVFRLTSRGALETLHPFNGSDGASPSGNLVRAASCDPNTSGSSRECREHDDLIFGTTERGGPCDAGTVFRLTAHGKYAILHAFSGSDGSSPSGLTPGGDGNFYGATQSGGAFGRGTLFKMTPAGVLTTLHSFNGNDGAAPRGMLIRAGAGFFGTTEFGGAYNSGTLFRISSAGGLTTLHAFSFGEDGALPLAGLALGSDGNFYGTTYQGARGYGTLYRITAAGELSTLHAFYPPDGDGGQPAAALLRGGDGALYGTTEAGGGAGAGTIFRFDAQGALTILHSFNGSDGSNPQAALIQGDGNAFFGTTTRGGSHSSGAVFRFGRRALTQSDGREPGSPRLAQ